MTDEEKIQEVEDALDGKMTQTQAEEILCAWYGLGYVSRYVDARFEVKGMCGVFPEEARKLGYDPVSLEDTVNAALGDLLRGKALMRKRNVRHPPEYYGA